jgi:Fur family peroxide stress response transcriptional regulator
MMAHQRERLEEFVKVCKEKGLKITPQRLAVYEILLRREDHPTVEEIYEEVKEIYPFVSLATVYRTVETLEGLGFIKRVAYWGSSVRYDANVQEHDHLVCVMCGAILDLKAEAGCRVPEEVNGFKVLSHSLYIYGVCPSCQKEGLKHYSPEEVFKKYRTKSPNGNTRMDTSAERSHQKLEGNCHAFQRHSLPGGKPVASSGCGAGF